MSSASPVLPALERFKALARLVLAASVGLALLLAPPRSTPLFPLLGVVFGTYFLYAAAGLFFYRQITSERWQMAMLLGDAAALGVVLLFAPRHPAAFLLFFLYFALLAGLWRGWWAAAGLSLLVGAAYLGLAWKESAAARWSSLPETILHGESWGAVVGLLAAGLLMGTLAQRERRHIERAALLERFVALLNLDARWPELWQRWFSALLEHFRAGRALLAYHDPETDRVAVWQYAPTPNNDEVAEADLPPRDALMLLLGEEPVSLLGNRLDRPGAEDWRLRREFTSVGVENDYSLPVRFRERFSPRSLLSVPLPVQGSWRARLFLLDAQGGSFELDHLEGLQRLLEGLLPLLANLLTVRSLMTERVNQERDRISRELHDGVAQTLASLDMQLDVYRRSAAGDGVNLAEELSRLKSVVKQEQESLRRYIRTLKPVRVPATELTRWVLAHCAQFQQETGIELDVEAEPVDATLPEGVCREVFLILREALHNVQKHSGAQNVLVRLRQDDAYLRLLVDDDGRGFSFAGTYSQVALEEKGLLPVSIGEHTRAVGGTLSIESSPGGGATLRVDIPLR